MNGQLSRFEELFPESDWDKPAEVEGQFYCPMCLVMAHLNDKLDDLSPSDDPAEVERHMAEVHADVNHYERKHLEVLQRRHDFLKERIASYRPESVRRERDSRDKAERGALAWAIGVVKQCLPPDKGDQ